jgi:signal transduction histidine kinase
MRRNLLRTLKLRLHAAEAALGRRDELLAMIAHELRTPVNAVLGWSQLLSARHGISKATTRRAISAIGRSAEQQLRLVNDLLDRHLLSRGELHLEVATVDLSDIAARALDTTRPIADERNVTLVSSLDRPLFMRGDAGRLQQVVVNLVVNAVSFSPAGGRVTVSAHRRNHLAELIVMDSGPGIENGLLPVIFEPFQRGRGNQSRLGLGLGLAIAKAIVELHGGSIRAQNAIFGSGSVFTVTLPAEMRRRSNDGVREHPDAEANLPRGVVNRRRRSIRKRP